MSDRDADRLQLYLVKAVEKTGASINNITVTVRSNGRPSVNRPKVVKYLNDRRVGPLGAEGITVEEVIEHLEMRDSGVRKQLRKLVSEGWLQRQFQVGEEARYRLVHDHDISLD